jgi:hypothetical protein
MNIVLSEIEGTHIAVLMGITESNLSTSLDSIIYAVESHIDAKIDETNLTEDELEDCINQPWDLNRGYFFIHYTNDGDDTRINVNIQTANVFY